MVSKKGDPNRGDEKARSGLLKGGSLDSILADMLRTALAWEEEHGNLSDNESISPMTSSDGAQPALPPIIIKGGDKNDHVDSCQEWQEPNHL